MWCTRRAVVTLHSRPTPGRLRRASPLVLPTLVTPHLWTTRRYEGPGCPQDAAICTRVANRLWTTNPRLVAHSLLTTNVHPLPTSLCTASVVCVSGSVACCRVWLWWTYRLTDRRASSRRVCLLVVFVSCCRKFPRCLSPSDRVRVSWGVVPGLFVVGLVGGAAVCGGWLG